MSTLLYTLREHVSSETAGSRQDRRQVQWAIILVAACAGPGVFLVDRIAGTVTWRSFLAEALSLCLYAAVAVWYGLRFQRRTAWRVALGVYAAGLAVMGCVDLFTKRGLDRRLVDSSRASTPLLWIGALMLLFVPLLGWVARRYPLEMGRVGVGHAMHSHPSRLQLLAGLGVGLLIGLHFWLAAKAVGVHLGLKPWPYLGWQLFYELGPQSLPEELFMRGVVFNELYFGRAWNFWAAALAASSIELLSLLVKQDYTASVLVITGVIFYTIVSAVTSAGLFVWSRRILPGYVNNVVFSMVTALR